MNFGPQTTKGAWQSQTWGRPAPQVRVQNQFQEDEILLAEMAGRMKKVSENTSTIRKLWTLARWILKLILSFHDFFLGGGRPQSPFGCVLVEYKF